MHPTEQSQEKSQFNQEQQENVYPFQDEQKQNGSYVAEPHVANLMTSSCATASLWAPPKESPNYCDLLEEGSSAAFIAKNVDAEAFLERLEHLPAAADLVQDVIFP
jgi:hypothetical protein